MRQCKNRNVYSTCKGHICHSRNEMALNLWKGGKEVRCRWRTLAQVPAKLLSRFSHVRLSATPETAAHQASPSLGFSRQEPWSGLPFPSPMHESEKWKWSCSVVSDSSRPHGLQPTRLLRPWDFPGKSTGVGCHRLLQFPAALATYSLRNSIKVNSGPTF